MREEFVETGIDVIGSVPWGTHFCQFYQTKGDLLDILVPYFRTGLENNEFCMWITAEPLTAAEARQAMRRAMPDFADRLAKGQIEILPHTRWYLKGGIFDQQRVLDGWVNKLNAGLAKGFAGLRLSGNTFWLEKPDWKSFTDYEAAVNDVIGRYRMMALCTYSLDKCGAAEIMDVIRNHEFALMRREGKWELIESAMQAQAKRALFESESRYRQLVESLQEGVWVIDEDARTTFVNPRMAEMLGYSAEEMSGKRLFEFVNEPHLGLARERMERRRQGIKELVEFQFRRKDGSPLHALVSAAPLTDHLGRFSGVVAGVVDVTERKQAGDALRTSEERYRGLYQSVAGGIVVQDKNGVITEANALAREILGLTRDEITGRTSANPEWQAVREDGSPFPGEAHPAMVSLRTGEPVHGVVMGVFHPTSGQRRWILINSEPVLDPKTHLVEAVTTTFLDITERRRMEDYRLQAEHRTRLLAETASELLKADSPERLVTSLCAKVMNYLDCDVFFNFLADESAGRLRLNAFAGVSEEQAKEIEWLEYGAAICGCAARDRCRLVAENIFETPDPRTELVKSYGIQAYACHPLVAQDRLLGTLSFGTRKRSRFSDEDLSLMSAVSDLVAIAIERQQSKETLTGSEARYRGIVETAQEGIVIGSPDGRFVFVNKRMADMLGYSREEILGKTGLDLMDGDQKDAVLSLRKRLGEGQTVHAEYRFRRKDGSPLWTLCSASAIRDEAGQHLGNLAMHTDITGRKQAEEALQESEELFKAIADNTPDHILVQDSRLRYTYVANPQIGLSEKDMLGKTDHEILTKEDAQKLTQIKSEVMATGKPFHVEESLVNKDGQLEYFSGSYVPKLNREGHPDGLIGYFQNVTERKKAEEALEKTRFMLSEGQLIAHVGSFEYVAETKTTVWSDEECRIYGIAPGTPSPPYEVMLAKFIHPDEAALLHATFTKAMESGSVYELEHRIVRPDGEIRIVYDRAHPHFDENGNLIRYVGATLDITETKRAEEALRETRDYLDNLLNHANAPIIVWDPELRITRFNRAFQKLTGYEESKVLGRHLEILFPEETRDESLAHIARTAAGERWEVIEIPIRRRDGVVRTVLWNSANIRGSDGRTTVSTIAQGQDITDRKLAEDALRETRDYLDNLLNYANAPVIVWDPEFRITKFNRAFQRLTGYKESEVLGKELETLFPEQTRDESLAHIRRAMAGERWEVVEIPIQRVDGEVRTVLWNSATIYAPDGKTAAATIAQGQDITERKAAEEQLGFQASILSHIFDAVVATDNDQRVTYWNKIAEELYGIPAAQAIGRKAADFYEVTWLNREDEQDSARDLAGKGHWIGDTFHIKKNGERLYVRSSVSMIRDEDGKAVGTVAVIRDRTKLWQAEQEVKLLNERLRQQAEDRLRATDASFRRAISSSADGIVVVRKDGVIRFANPAAEALLGHGAAELVGTLFSFPLVEGTEIEILKDNGERAFAEMRIVELDWEGAPAYLATLRDVTRRKQGYVALQESETRLRLLLEQIPCVSWTLDTKMRFTSFAGSGLGFFTDPPDQIRGMTLSEYFKVDDLDFTPYVTHRQALRGTPATYELNWADRTFYGRVEPLRDADDRIVGVVGVAFDITDRKLAEEQLRSLSHRLVTAQENERRKIARELHDQVGQSLTALKLSLDKVSLSGSPGNGSELGEARKALRELMGQVRSMSLELRPTMLDDLGLLPTLLWHCERYTAQTGVRVNFKHRGLRKDLPPEIVTAAYRIVQEALTNVARHAQVNEVQVCVRGERDALVVEVEDQGVGFNIDDVASASMGLNGMRERALSLNGKLLVQSKPGEGTCVIAELPLASRRTKRARSKGNVNRSSG